MARTHWVAAAKAVGLGLSVILSGGAMVHSAISWQDSRYVSKAEMLLFSNDVHTSVDELKRGQLDAREQTLIGEKVRLEGEKAQRSLNAVERQRIIEIDVE